MGGANTPGGYAGPRDDSTDGSEFNVFSFMIKQMVGRMSTSTMVQVKAVYGGGLGPIGLVDVIPLVHTVDGFGKTIPHGTVYRLAYGRVQAGLNAIILDPVVGDVGVCVFADRDISTVKAVGANAGPVPGSPPGSKRRFDFADGIYLMMASSKSSQLPTQYIRFLPAGGGIVIKSPGNVTINGTVTITPGGDIGATGYVKAGVGTGDQVGLQTHTHTQGNDSHGDTESPTAAPTAGT